MTSGSGSKLGSAPRRLGFVLSILLLIFAVERVTLFLVIGVKMKGCESLSSLTCKIDWWGYGDAPTGKIVASYIMAVLILDVLMLLVLLVRWILFGSNDGTKK
ncbi:MAG: hypothetical protein ABIQ04_00455 [Candidatus Saccharimonadales bacterium]